nr:unnamed protein product [Callosobruchus chinensis]
MKNMFVHPSGLT